MPHLLYHQRRDESLVRDFTLDVFASSDNLSTFPPSTSLNATLAASAASGAALSTSPTAGAAFPANVSSAPSYHGDRLNESKLGHDMHPDIFVHPHWRQFENTHEVELILTGIFIFTVGVIGTAANSLVIAVFTK